MSVVTGLLSACEVGPFRKRLQQTITIQQPITSPTATVVTLKSTLEPTEFEAQTTLVTVSLPELRATAQTILVDVTIGDDLESLLDQLNTVNVVGDGFEDVK